MTPSSIWATFAARLGRPWDFSTLTPTVVPRRLFRAVFILGVAAFSGTVHRLQAGLSVSALSTNSPSGSAGATGNGLTGDPIFSADGRWLVFASSANNLVADDRPGAWLDVFRRNLVTGTTELLTAGSDASSVPLGVSADGGTVLVLSSASTLTTNSPGVGTQLYLFSPGSLVPTLVSGGLEGAPANGSALDGTLTPDGRWVAFESQAGNLVNGDTNQASDIFLCEVTTGTRRSVSGGQTNAARGDASLIGLSDDAHYLTYRLPVRLSSQATNIVRQTDLVLVDVLAGTEQRLVAPGPRTRDDLTIPTDSAVFSSDGRSLAARIAGFAFAQVYGPSEADVGGVIWWDLAAGTNAVVYARPPAGEASRLGDAIRGPTLGTDKGTVLLNYLDPMLANGPLRLGIWRPETGLRSLTELVATVPPAGPPAEPLEPEEALFTPDGQSLIFSAALNTNITSRRSLYRRHLATGATDLLVRDLNGAPVEVQLPYPEVSPDGRWLAFASESSVVVSNDINKSTDLYLVNLLNGDTSSVAKPVAGVVDVFGDGFSNFSPNSMSADGGRVVFSSTVPTLTGNDRNGSQDVFLHDRATGLNTLVSVGTNGFSGEGASNGGLLSADGSVVVFGSRARGLTGGTNSREADLYYRDLVRGSTQRITHRFDSSDAANQTGELPAISGDGRYVVYFSRASDLTADWTPVRGAGFYLFDARTGTNRWLPIPPPFGLPAAAQPAISRDGSTIAVLRLVGGLGNLHLYRSDDASLIRTLPSAGSLVALSPDGQWVAYSDRTGVWVASSRSNEGSIRMYTVTTSSPTFGDLAFTGDGRNVLFSVSAVFDGVVRRRVVLAPLFGAPPDVVSEPDQNPAGAYTARQASASADGRFVSFLSNGTHLVPGLPPASHVFIRDRRLGVTYVADPTATVDAAGTQLSSDGRTLVFFSRASLIAGDQNGVQDIHQATLTDDAVPADFDRDGLPDAWERQFFYGLQSGPTDDNDGDAVSNLEEFRAGTSPARPPLVYNLSTTIMGTNSAISLSLKPAYPTALRVYWRRDLLEPWTYFSSSSIGGGDYQTSFSINPDVESGFFRFDLEQ